MKLNTVTESPLEIPELAADETFVAEFKHENIHSRLTRIKTEMEEVKYFQIVARKDGFLTVSYVRTERDWDAQVIHYSESVRSSARDLEDDCR